MSPKALLFVSIQPVGKMNTKSMILLHYIRKHGTYDVRAYDFKPDESSCASKVPIQPRNDLCPLRDRVFHVTKRG